MWAQNHVIREPKDPQVVRKSFVFNLRSTFYKEYLWIFIFFSMKIENWQIDKRQNKIAAFVFKTKNCSIPISNSSFLTTLITVVQIYLKNNHISISLQYFNSVKLDLIQATEPQVKFKVETLAFLKKVAIFWKIIAILNVWKTSPELHLRITVLTRRWWCFNTYFHQLKFEDCCFEVESSR